MTTPYLTRIPASKMSPNTCAYCGITVKDGDKQPVQVRKTRDHILARTHGRTYPGTYNTRPSCLQCNFLRAALGHCVGALMLSIIEGKRRRLDYVHMSIKLGMRLPSRRRVRRIKMRRMNKEYDSVDVRG